MATKQRSRSRRSGPSRDRAAAYVAPVLDPSWQSPYLPSTAERVDNQQAVRRFAVRRKVPQSAVILTLTVALIVVGALVAWWLAVVGILLAALYAWDVRRSLVKFEQQGLSLGSAMLAQFEVGGTTKDRQRLITVLDRLSATFGADGVAGFIVNDPGYNAALVPDGAKHSLFVTNALMRDFALIELEGVVAHCLARQRLGLLARESVASVANLNDDLRRQLAGGARAYRADEVAAASIRYPLGLAGALRKCAGQVLPSDSFFAGPTYAQWRWIWFDIWSDRPLADVSDLDDVTLRARALEEW